MACPTGYIAVKCPWLQATLGQLQTSGLDVTGSAIDSVLYALAIVAYDGAQYAPVPGVYGGGEITIGGPGAPGGPV